MTNTPDNHLSRSHEEAAVLEQLFIDPSQISYERQREIVTSAIGNQLDGIFDRHASFATQDEDGTQRVSIKVRLSASTVPAHVTSKVDETGTRTAFMWLEPGKALGTEMYKYTDGPDTPPLLEPYTLDPDTKQPVPRTAGKHYDPNDHKEVAYWGKAWVRNLKESAAFKPAPRLGRSLGRLSLRKRTR